MKSDERFELRIEIGLDLLDLRLLFTETAELGTKTAELGTKTPRLEDWIEAGELGTKILLDDETERGCRDDDATERGCRDDEASLR